MFRANIPLLFLLHVNDKRQAVDCDLFLYADDSCLVYQLKDVQERERNLNKNFLEVCDRFVDNKLSIHFGEDKTKCIPSGTKHRLNESVYLILNLVRYTLSNITQ